MQPIRIQKQYSEIIEQMWIHGVFVIKIQSSPPNTLAMDS
jgi:hypothetical protein